MAVWLSLLAKTVTWERLTIVYSTCQRLFTKKYSSKLLAYGRVILGIVLLSAEMTLPASCAYYRLPCSSTGQRYKAALQPMHPQSNHEHASHVLECLYSAPHAQGPSACTVPEGCTQTGLMDRISSQVHDSAEHDSETLCREHQLVGASNQGCAGHNRRHGRQPPCPSTK